MVYLSKKYKGLYIAVFYSPDDGGWYAEAIDPSSCSMLHDSGDKIFSVRGEAIEAIKLAIDVSSLGNGGQS